MRTISLLFCLACTDTGGDSAVFDAPPEDDTLSATAVLITSDYQVGALATLDLVTNELSDTLTTIHSDAAVSSGGGAVFQINRLGMDSIRIYEPGSWGAPLLEFSTGESSNPHQAALCANQLLVTLYGLDYIGVFDPDTGAQTGAVDLSAWDDGDGTPEASAMVIMEDRAYVALQQFYNWESTSGTVIELDCSDLEITQTWTTGPSPSISQVRGSTEEILVSTGNWWAEDGHTQILDLADGTLSEPFLLETEFGQDIYGVVATHDRRAVAIGYPIGGEDLHTIYCGDIDGGTFDTGPSLPNPLSGLALISEERMLVSAGTPWSGMDAPAGLFHLNPETCTIQDSSEWIQTTLPVTDMTLVGLDSMND
jgi:hypothetical protein